MVFKVFITTKFIPEIHNVILEPIYYRTGDKFLSTLLRPICGLQVLSFRIGFKRLNVVSSE